MCPVAIPPVPYKNAGGVLEPWCLLQTELRVETVEGGKWKGHSGCGCPAHWPTGEDWKVPPPPHFAQDLPFLATRPSLDTSTSQPPHRHWTSSPDGPFVLDRLCKKGFTTTAPAPPAVICLCEALRGLISHKSVPPLPMCFKSCQPSEWHEGTAQQPDVERNGGDSRHVG